LARMGHMAALPGPRLAARSVVRCRLPQTGKKGCVAAPGLQSPASAAMADDRSAVQAANRKNEVLKAIKEGFALFDRDGKGICDVREIGTIVRHLGVCPTEIELRDMIGECEEEEPTGFIRFERFERMMSRVLLDNQYPRDGEEKLLRAFRVHAALELCTAPARHRPIVPVPTASALPSRRASLLLPDRAPFWQTLDPDNKGFIEVEKMRTLLTTHGERFSQEEIDDFLSFAADPEGGLIYYDDYVAQVSI
jgi:Ca2+-binding EF-hand superfamily protein